MPIHNADIATVFEAMADLLEIKGDNPFRIRAYRNAARAVGDMPNELQDMVQEDADLTQLPGIGKDLAEKIKEFVTTGSVKALEELRSELPPRITDLLKIQGLGPKRVRALYEGLKIDTLDALKKAAQEKKIRELPGFGEKTETTILEAIESQIDTTRRFLRASITPYAESLTAYMQELKGIQQITVAGSYRRAQDNIGDLDMLVIAAPDCPVMDRFVAYDEVLDVLAKGETKSSVILRSGLQVDLRLVPPASYGAALHYFTGSKAHNIALRKIAQQKELKLNEYGLFSGETSVAGETETDIYRALDLPYIEPELRENRGEIEAAQTGALPKLIKLEDIRGNLHGHTTWSDGAHTIEEMAEAARERGHEYIAITDHSKRLTIANGLNEDRLMEQMDEIDRINETLKGITLLKGIEVDILQDGTLDLPDSVLKLLDIVGASVHSHFNLPSDQQTDRIRRAMDNPNVTFISHPTGRLLLARAPYAVDMTKLIDHAHETGCMLELNAHPQRMDLSDIHCQWAKRKGVMITINTDAHRASDLDFYKTGIGQARRGWLEKEDVLNTRSLKELRKLLHRGKA